MAFSEAFLAWEQEVINRGRQKGLQETVSEIALKMLGKQIEIETIAEVTGLPIAQIQEIQSQAATS